MQQADPILHTKLHLPFTRPEIVLRPRLQQEILRGFNRPLTVITAPAGFGKTTLLASSITNCGMPVAWLSLDKNDNQAGRFLTYLIAALQHTDDRIGCEAVQLTAGIQQASSEAVLTSLLNDLVNIQMEFALVLDDYHLITNPAVHEEMAFLLEHQPITFHLVISTRSDPPLPLARLRARSQTVELRAADLRFTEEETAQFLNQVMGLHLDDGSIAALEARTEGWIAGLQMAALSMRDRNDIPRFIEGFSGTNRFILDYLLEEVLANQPPEIQRFLLYSSILERLSAPLCDTLLADDGSVQQNDTDRKTKVVSHANECSAAYIKFLDRENLFLVSLDDDKTWFRYHHLFADLLKARLHQSQPDLVHVLHLRASTWLERNGLIPEAIHHLLAAKELSRAADLIERYGSVRWVNSDLSVIQMADNLPREMLIDRPKIGLYQVWFLINQGLIEKAYPLLIEMEQRLAGMDAKSEQHWIQLVVRLALAFLTPPTAPGSGPLPDPSEMDEIPSDEVVLRDAADILYGMALGRRGEWDHAAEFSQQSMQRQDATYARMKAEHSIPSLVPFLATVYLFQGKLRVAADLCQKYIDPIKEKGIRTSTSGNMEVVLGNVYYERNLLDEAEKVIREGLESNEPWHNIMTDGFGLLALTYVLKAKGDFNGALQIAGKFESRLQDQTRPREFAEPFHTLRISILLASGDLKTAFDWADQIILSEDYKRQENLYLLTLARIRLAQGRFDEVEEILARDPSHDLFGNLIVRQIELLLLHAAALAGKQRLPEAFGFIESSFALAEPEGYIQVFLNEGEPIRALLSSYLRTTSPAHALFAQKVLDAFPRNRKTESPGSLPNIAGLVEPISERELEVLRLMAEGKTNQEIARQLVVARGTIKAHAANIFRKLDAANRTEAVARARQSGILP